MFNSSVINQKLRAQDYRKGGGLNSLEMGSLKDSTLKSSWDFLSSKLHVVTCKGSCHAVSLDCYCTIAKFS